MTKKRTIEYWTGEIFVPKSKIVSNFFVQKWTISWINDDDDENKKKIINGKEKNIIF